MDTEVNNGVLNAFPFSFDEMQKLREEDFPLENATDLYSLKTSLEVNQLGDEVKSNKFNQEKSYILNKYYNNIYYGVNQLFLNLQDSLVQSGYSISQVNSFFQKMLNQSISSSLAEINILDIRNDPSYFLGNLLDKIQLYLENLIVSQSDLINPDLIDSVIIFTNDLKNNNNGLLSNNIELINNIVHSSLEYIRLREENNDYKYFTQTSLSYIKSGVIETDENKSTGTDMVERKMFKQKESKSLINDYNKDFFYSHFLSFYYKNGANEELLSVELNSFLTRLLISLIHSDSSIEMNLKNQIINSILNQHTLFFNKELDLQTYINEINIILESNTQSEKYSGIYNFDYFNQTFEQIKKIYKLSKLEEIKSIATNNTIQRNQIYQEINSIISSKSSFEDYFINKNELYKKEDSISSQDGNENSDNPILQGDDLLNNQVYLYFFPQNSGFDYSTSIGENKANNPFYVEGKSNKEISASNRIELNKKLILEFFYFNGFNYLNSFVGDTRDFELKFGINLSNELSVNDFKNILQSIGLVLINSITENVGNGVFSIGVESLLHETKKMLIQNPVAGMKYFFDIVASNLISYKDVNLLLNKLINFENKSLNLSTLPNFLSLSSKYKKYLNELYKM